MASRFSFAIMQFQICFAILLPSSWANAFVDHANVGVMYSMFDVAGQVDTAGIMQLTSMQIALDHINNKTDGVADELLPKIELRMVARAPLPTFTSGAVAAIEMTYSSQGKSVVACAGPGSIDAMRGSSRVLKDLDIPIVGYNLPTAELADWYNYQNVLRTNPLEIYSALATVDIAVQHSWRRVSVMYSEDREQYGGRNDILFLQQAEMLGMEILSWQSVITGHEAEAIQEMKAVGANIFILFFDPAAALPLLRLGHEMGVFGEGKQIIGTERMSVAENWEGLDVTAGELNTLLRGYIGVRWEETPDTASVYYQSFLASWYRLESTAGVMQRDGSEACSNATDDYGEFYLHQAGGVCAGLNYSSFSVADLWPAYSAYDAVFAIARGYHSVREREGANISPAALYDHMLHELSFDGVTGRVEFNMEYEDLLFDLGGRAGDMSFRIVNYQYDESDSLAAAGSFHPMMLWTSRDGLADSCDSVGCSEFRYNTKDNSPPKDRPDPVVVEYPERYRVVVYTISILNIGLLMFYAACIFCFRERRIVKVAQPQLSYIVLFGALLLFLSALVQTERASVAVCSTSYWLLCIGCGCIFIVLALKLWRVYEVCGAMKRRTVALKDVYHRFSVCFLALLAVVVVNQVMGINAVEVTTRRDQFVYERELVCRREADIIFFIYLYLVLGVGVYFCCLTRHVDSTLSKVSQKIRAIMAGTLSLAVVAICRYVVDWTPNQYRFLFTMLVMAAVAFITWELYFNFCVKLLLGAELDRSLRETRTAWSVMDTRLVGALMNRFAHGGVGSAKTFSVSECDESRKMQLNTYISMTTDELNAELSVLKATIASAREAIVYVENVKYTMDEDSTFFGPSRNSSGKEQSL